MFVSQISVRLSVSALNFKHQTSICSTRLPFPTSTASLHPPYLPIDYPPIPEPLPEVRAQPRRPSNNDKIGLTCFIILQTIDLLRAVELHGASSALPGSDRALERGLPASRSFLRRRFPDVA